MTNRLRAGLAVLLAALAFAAHGAPFVPADDDEVVERLPQRLGAELRRQRAALARDPLQLPLALATARQSIDRARQLGDPRELGHAQAALAPWWSRPDAPPAARLLKAVVLQSQHQFDAALRELDALVEDPRADRAVQAQAALTRVTLLQLRGRLADAQRACEQLADGRFATLGAGLQRHARACATELLSLRGDPRAAAAELAALARDHPDDRWLALLRAEAAQRRGDHAEAEAAFRIATAGTPDVYAISAFADWLLEQGRAPDALALLQAHGGDADALLLRRAIAWRQLGDARAAAATQALLARFEAARRRGEGGHEREQARLALDLLDRPAEAVELARANWARQQEPADALLLARAEARAGEPRPGAALRHWVADPAQADVRLARWLAKESS